MDFTQARTWFEKAAAQDEPSAVDSLGTIYFEGKDVTPSWRRAREYYQRAIELGDSRTVESMQNLTTSIQAVAPLMDRRVEVHGLIRADMNGKRGVANDFHPMGGPTGDRTTWRYTVKLDGGEAFKLKRANVRAEGAGGGGEGGSGGGASAGKAKGKKGGKKGRGGRK